MQSFNSLSPKYRYYFWHSVPNSGLTKFRNGLSTCRQLSSTKVDGARLTSLASLSLWEFTSVYCTTQIRQPVARVHPRYFYIRSPALIANSRVCDCTVEHWHRLAAGTLPSPITPPPPAAMTSVKIQRTMAWLRTNPLHTAQNRKFCCV